MNYTPLDVVLKTEHESYEMKVLRFILDRDKQHREELDTAYFVIGLITVALLLIYRDALYHGYLAIVHFVTNLFLKI